MERGNEKVVYVIIRAHTVSLSPRARIIMKRGLTVAIGGNIETERAKPRINTLYRTLSFARPKEHNDPIIRERIVVDAATVKLFMIILKKGCPLNIDI